MESISEYVCNLFIHTEMYKEKIFNKDNPIERNLKSIKDIKNS